MTAEHLQEGQRVTAIPVDLKVLATLHVYRTGGYQLTTGQGYNFSQPSMSRCINEVTNVINNHLLPNWIVFLSTKVEKNKIMEGFLNKFNFPRCLGAIDCSHIAIISPPENYPALPYYSRKGYYSINCQIITDSDYKILNISSLFPGTIHNAAIWRQTSIP